MSMTDQWTFSQEPNFCLMTVLGADAEKFLQGQFTQDIVKLEQDKARWTATCNYQGRVASSALIFRVPEGFGLLLPKSIAESEQNRLKKYILRSKVTIAISDKPVHFMATTDVNFNHGACPGLPEAVMGVYNSEAVSVVRLNASGLDGFKAKYIAFGTLPHPMMQENATTDRLADALMSEGVALIELPQTLQWLPQALNMDLINAISFSKGCYTGQEVVAKTQHLGRVKRRLFLAEVQDIVPAVNDEIFCGTESIGTVIQVNQNKFFCVLPVECDQTQLTLKAKAVKVIALPYEVTNPKSVI